MPSDEIKRWVGTWAAAPQLVEPHNMPPNPGLPHNTLRQVIRVSLGGSQIRLRLSNEYGNSPLKINQVCLADHILDNKIKADTSKTLTFNGSNSITIPAGGTVISDKLQYTLCPLSTLAISIYFGDTPSSLTGHPGSRTTSYIERGNGTVLSNMPSAIITEHWYVITGIDILTDDPDYAVVVAIGDSLTDGRGSTTNKNNRWPDVLANRLFANAKTSKIGVLNQGIGGNAVLFGGLGPTVTKRFERDVLAQCGVRYLIILAGINDIGGANANLQTAEGLISAYNTFIKQAHQKDILVYGATILPFGGSIYDNPQKEQLRQTINEWIRTSGEFDAVVDWDVVICDPGNPERIFSLYDSGDHLHLSPEGYKELAGTIDLNLF